MKAAGGILNIAEMDINVLAFGEFMC